MGRKEVLRTAATAVAVTAGALSLAGGAQAKSHDSGSGYPQFLHEDKYPEDTNCRFRERARAFDKWAGRTVTLRYFYSPGCGSYGRIDNAPRDCQVYLDRTNDDDTPDSWSYVAETVDPGLDFAYTRIGNNLDGRLSRAALVCGGKGNRTAIARTPFM